MSGWAYVWVGFCPTAGDIYVVERVHATGSLKSQGLIGLHNFTGADWGGKFVGITKEKLGWRMHDG